MKATATKTNKRGIRYALVQDGETFGVWKLCENYSRHVRGGIERTWRYVQKDMTEADARKLFERRAA